jgi:hypothetical protein
MSARARMVTVVLPLAAALLIGCGRDPATPQARDDAAAVSAPAPDKTASSPAGAASADAPPTTEPSEPSVAVAAEPQEASAREQATATAAPASRPPKPASTASNTSAAVPATGSAMTPMPGVVTRPTELKAAPAIAAQTLRTLASDTPVTITTRQGGWLQVTSGDARGWVRLLHVSSQPAARTSGAREELEAAARVATGRAGSGNIAVTTGIRGLDEDQLRDAQPDTEELKRLESLGAQPADAQAHARRRGLERRQLPYPPVPSR